MQPDRTHHVVVITTFEDGHVSNWTYYNRPGAAKEAHDRLAARWKAAGYEFNRDRAALTLSRHIADESRGGPYTDTIAHEDA